LLVELLIEGDRRRRMQVRDPEVQDAIASTRSLSREAQDQQIQFGVTAGSEDSVEDAPQLVGRQRSPRRASTTRSGETRRGVLAEMSRLHGAHEHEPSRVHEALLGTEPVTGATTRDGIGPNLDSGSLEFEQ
jgi:hypothetical protein